MTARIGWTKDLIHRVTVMTANGYSIRQIAKRLGINRTSIAHKLHELGLAGAPGVRATPSKPKPKAVLEAESFPRFEDDPAAEREWLGGPKPQREQRYSLTGNSSAMCAWVGGNDG